MAIAGFPMEKNIPVRECDFLYASVGDEIEITHIPVRESLQNNDNDAQSPTVCNKTSEMMRNSPSKTNKPQDPDEFIKQLRQLADNLKKPAKKKKKKTERSAQDAV